MKHYGIAQGHSTANLQKLASKAGTKVNSFVPPEAESPEDVRNRAISFFKVKFRIVITITFIMFILPFF